MKIVENHADCSDDSPFGVTDDDGNLIEGGCFETRDEAQAKIEADAGGDTDAAVDGPRFVAVMAIEGFETSDGRWLAAGEGSSRDLPMPFMFMATAAHGGFEPGQSVIAGRWDTIEFTANGQVRGTGTLDGGGEMGQEAERLIRGGFIRSVSIDLGEVGDVETIALELDDDGWPTKSLTVFHDWSIMGATGVPFSAFAGTYIWMEDQDEPAGIPTGMQDLPEGIDWEVPTLMDILASGAPSTAPAAWFDDPELDAPTALTITDEGRVYGHIYQWGTCHIGQPGCLTAPPSRSKYAYFRTGEVVCDDGTRVATGPLTVGTGHAALRGQAALHVTAHYDNTGLAAADVAAGEDAFGIWVAGTVRPGVTDAQIAALRASAPSGDWRRIGGHLELVACLMVNTPGFPVPRAITAGGDVQALVAAAGPHVNGDCGCDGGAGLAQLQAIVARQQRMIDAFTPMILDHYATEFAAAQPVVLTDREKRLLKIAALGR